MGQYCSILAKIIYCCISGSGKQDSSISFPNVFANIIAMYYKGECKCYMWYLIQTKGALILQCADIPITNIKHTSKLVTTTNPIQSILYFKQ